MQLHTQNANANANARAPHLRIDGVSKSFPDRRVLTDISLSVASGERIGLIGENGSGKSTLLGIVAGDLEPSAGTVAVAGVPRGEATIGLLRQIAPFDPAESVSQALERAVQPSRDAVLSVTEYGAAMAEKPDDAGVQQAFADALDRAERLDAWAVDARIAQMLAGLGLARLDTTAKTAELSGGERARLSLAWLLLSAPDVLLLDEPTNHLDDRAAEHLRGVLLGWKGPVLIASHDRWLLDQVTTGLVDLDPAPRAHRAGEEKEGAWGITRFTGSYGDYREHRAETMRRWQQQYLDEQAELKRLKAGISTNQQVGHEGAAPRTEGRVAKKFYADRNARVVARRVNDVRSRLDTAEAAQIAKPPTPLEFAGIEAREANPDGDTGWALAATDVTLPGRLAQTSVNLDRGDKLLITGPNGAGKSTLLQALAGRLETAGTVAWHPELAVAVLGQELGARFSDTGDATANAVYLESARSAGSGTNARGGVAARSPEGPRPLASFGLLRPRDLERRFSELSVGQRRRVELASVLASAPDVLLLDEPTNHLSLALVEDLELALQSFGGTVIIASHDRWLRERWAGARLDLEPARQRTRHADRIA